MNYYLWVDFVPTYWWIARGDSPRHIRGMWFKSLSKWVERYPDDPERPPGEYMRSNQVVQVTEDEAYRVILSPTREVIEPLFRKYGASVAELDFMAENE